MLVKLQALNYNLHKKMDAKTSYLTIGNHSKTSFLLEMSSGELNRKAGNALCTIIIKSKLLGFHSTSQVGFAACGEIYVAMATHTSTSPLL